MVTISIVIPAFNEAALIPVCLQNVQDAWLALPPELLQRFSHEVIVTDNNSTDDTAALAKRAGAHVVFEPVNQIGRARNAGAAVATGDWLLFIDADSQLHPRTLRQLLQTIDGETIGAGGCIIELTNIPWWGRAMVQTWNLLSRMFRWAAGSFVFCRADAFRQIGGFDTQYFAAEEIYLSQALKRWCRHHQLGFLILHDTPHPSSGRKFDSHSLWQMLCFIARVVCFYPSAVRSRKALNFFYSDKARHASSERKPNSPPPSDR